MKKKNNSDKKIERQSSIINLIAAIANLILTFILLYEKLNR
jgi:hypothetical protein